MGEDPEVIRREIEQTRERMTETVDALGYKADVKSRAQEKVSDTVSSAQERVSGTMTSVKEAIVGAKDSVTGTASGTAGGVSDRASSVAGGVSDRASSVAGRVSDATPSAADIRQGVRRGAGMAQENPLGLAIGATALGFLAGLAIPTTRVEE